MPSMSTGLPGAGARGGTDRRRYGGRSAQERAEDRRSRLVEAAITVLAAQGERATMTAICQQAGLTERYFYESFANREAALVAALERVSDEISATAYGRCWRRRGPRRNGCSP